VAPLGEGHGFGRGSLHVKLVIGSIVGDAIGGSSTDSSRLASRARDAARYYLDDKDSGRPGWRYPRLGWLAPPAPSTCELALPAGDSVHAALAREAERQGVMSERLLHHALLYHLADVDAGRAD
jgi:hypothetical protein